MPAKRKTATAAEPALPPTKGTYGKRVPAIFFRTESGEPLREWLKSLPPEDRKLIGEDIKTVEFGWPVGSRYADPSVTAFSKYGRI